MKAFWVFCAVLACIFEVDAQPAVYLKSSGPAGFTITRVTNATPVVVGTAAPHGLNPGDTVVIWGVCGTTAANGLRQVNAVPDATHFSISDLGGTAVAGNGPWCSGADGSSWPAGPQGGGKVSAFSLTDQPRGFLDGSSGAVTRKLALGTSNGLVSFTVSGNVATVTTSYPHGVSVGDEVAVWNTQSALLNRSGAPYTVKAVTDTSFSFDTSSVGSGDYTTNNACGPSGDANCVRISQLAYAGNPWWDEVTNRITGGYTGSTAYKLKQDGGNYTADYSFTAYWAAAALQFFVDQANTQMLAACKYGINNIEKLNGVSWTGWDGVAGGGNNNFNDFASYTMRPLGLVYSIARDYLTPAEKQTFLDKMYNDWDDPAAAVCNSTMATRQVLASGAAQAGGANTITLSASDTAPGNYYVNNVIEVTVSGSKYYGLVSAYDANTRTATMAGNWSAVPNSGTPYAIYATIVVSSRTGNSSATVTGYNTTFTTAFAVGDAVAGMNTWNSQVQSSQSVVTAIASDTSMTVFNAASITASTTVPSIMWIEKQWKNGDCGLVWLQKHWQGFMGAQPSMYPAGGGNLAGWTLGGVTYPAWGSNNGGTEMMAHMYLGLALADDEPRAIKDLAMAQQQWFDYQLRYQLNYRTGFVQSGSYYGYVRVLRETPDAAWAIAKSVPSFPSMDLGGPWINNSALMKMYSALPEYRYDAGSGWNVAWPVRWGAQTGANQVSPSSGVSGGFVSDPGMYFNPTAASSRYLKNWIAARGLWAANAGIQTDAFSSLIRLDPRYPSADYTQQPTQYLFQATSQPTCAALTGWPCPSSFRGDAMISRTGWSNQSDTHVLFEARTFWTDHDLPEAGSLRVYKAGYLLSSDTSPHGAGVESYDPTKIDNLIEFGGTRNLNGGVSTGIPASATIIRWASGNHGSWNTAYGDAGSRYAYAAADLSGMYTTAYNRVQRHVVHFKESGTEEVIVQFDDVDASNAPTQIRDQVHYAQNGETNDGLTEGQTTCPGPNGCAGLDADRIVLSQEDGATHSHSTVTANFGIVSRFFSPGTIHLQDDGSDYTGAAHHTHRVSICGGPSCGSVVDHMEALIVHKIATLGDVNLTAKGLNPDNNWTGVQTADKVALFARGGVLRLMASFQTDQAGSSQYLLAGLQDGLRYRVYRPDLGNDVTQQAVPAEDNSLYFEGTAGNYMVFPAGLSNLILGSAAVPKMQAGAAYRYDFKIPGDPASYSGVSAPEGCRTA